MDRELFNRIIGGRITSINRICNLISIQISKAEMQSTFLHIQCFFRILKEDKIIICSEDMYRPKKQNSDFAWDIPGDSLFDYAMEKCEAELLSSDITGIHKNQTGDLEIIFRNGYLLQAFVDTVESEEKYRIFNEKSEVIIES